MLAGPGGIAGKPEAKHLDAGLRLVDLGRRVPQEPLIGAGAVLTVLYGPPAAAAGHRTDRRHDPPARAVVDGVDVHDRPAGAWCARHMVRSGLGKGPEGEPVQPIAAQRPHAHRGREDRMTMVPEGRMQRQTRATPELR